MTATEVTSGHFCPGAAMLRLFCMIRYADWHHGVACTSIVYFLSNTAFDLSSMKSFLIGEHHLQLSFHGLYCGPLILQLSHAMHPAFLKTSSHWCLCLVLLLYFFKLWKPSRSPKVRSNRRSWSSANHRQSWLFAGEVSASRTRLLVLLIFFVFVACFSLSNVMAHCSFKQPSFVNGCNIKTILRFSSFESVSCDVTCPWPRGFTFTPWHCHGFLSFEAACESSHLHKCKQSAGKHAYLQGKLWPYRLRRDWKNALAFCTQQSS